MLVQKFLLFGDHNFYLLTLSSKTEWILVIWSSNFLLCPASGNSSFSLFVCVLVYLFDVNVKCFLFVLLSYYLVNFTFICCMHLLIWWDKSIVYCTKEASHGNDSTKTKWHLAATAMTGGRGLDVVFRLNYKHFHDYWLCA